MFSWWSGGRGILIKLSLCCSILYHYNGAQWYEQFLQVDWVDWALILLGLAVCFPSASVSLVLMCMCIVKNFGYIFFHLLVSRAWWDWPFIWSTNYSPSVLWHCWLGRLTCKIPEMIYNVSTGTLNPTIPYHSYGIASVKITFLYY